MTDDPTPIHERNEPTDSRYGDTSAGGGTQDQHERKDDRGFESQQGGRQGRDPQDHGRRAGRDDADDG